MSTSYGFNKGKEGKYTTLNLTSYKGRSAETNKSTGSNVRHGLQSLGKVAGTRRVPPPATLPSLKSENSGNDPNVNLVPKDGSGWASKSESSSQPQSQTPQAQQESQLQQASTIYSQSATVQPKQEKAAPVNRNQNYSSSVQSGGSIQHQQMWGSSRSQAGSRVSGAAGGVRAHGTTPFSDDFPTLGDTNKDQETGTDTTREQQYGPGPNLRPQNVASWREGGGRNISQRDDKDISMEETIQDLNDQHNHMSHTFDVTQNMEPVQNMPQRPMTHQSGQNLPQGHPVQYRQNMMPQFMYSRYPPPRMGPPLPGVRYPPNMHPGMQYPMDPGLRYRGRMPSHPQGEKQGIPSIISSSELKEFDKLEKDDDGGWAAMHGEVDYGEKLVFSDDEEGMGEKQKSMRKEDDSQIDDESQGYDRRLKDSSGRSHPRQVWGQQQGYGMDPHTMQWQYLEAIQRGPFFNQPNINIPDGRSKTQQRIPPQGQPYIGGPMGHPHMHPPRPTGPRFPVTEGMDRVPPGGDEHRRNEKEEAVQLARRRREEEERRMELHGRQTLGSDSEYHGADGREVSQKAPDSSMTHEGGSGYKRQMSGSDDDKRSSRDRMPGDGFGGYTRGPHPSSGQQSGGRTLPPRFAQQRQQQQQQAWNRNEAWSQPPTRHSIMKRERSENDDMDGHSTGSRSRQISESSSHSQATPSGRETPGEERRSYANRDFYRKPPGSEEHFDSLSPSGERDQRLWLDGTQKRPGIKRPSSRDSPSSIGSSNETRRNSHQKTLLSRNDSGKTVTKWGSSQSEKSTDRDEDKSSNQQQAPARRRGVDKVKLRDFRVDNGADESGSPTNDLHRNLGKDGQPERGQHEPRSWKTKPPKPVKVEQSTYNRSNQDDNDADSVSFKDVHKGIQASEKKEQQTELPRTQSRDRPAPDESRLWSDRDSKDTRNHRARDAIPRYNSRDMHRPDRPYNDEGRSEEGKDDHHHRKPNKYDSRPQEKMNSSEPKRDRQRKEFSEKAPDEKFDRREKDQYNRSDKDRYNKSDRHDRNDRYDNRNKGKEQQQDGKRENVDRRDKGRPFNSSQPSQNKRKESPRRPASKPTHKSDVKVEKSEAENPPISTVINAQVKQPVVEAAPPPTNIWEERKRQMQKDVDKTTLTYIPTEEDKKRTLKETAPVKSEELVFFNKALLSEKGSDENKPVTTTISKDNYSEKRFDSKPPRDGNRRGSSSRQISRNERRSDAGERSERGHPQERRGRGRGRSRGSSLRGGRAADRHERKGERSTFSTEKTSSSIRGYGRGRRGARSAPASERGVRHSTTSRQYAKQNENYTSEETASDSEQAKVNGVGRRRKVDEESDYDDTTESYTDDDTTSVKPTKQEKPLGVKKLPPRTLEPRRNVPKHYRQEGNNRQETAYTKQDPSYSRQDTSYSRKDTSYSRQDTSYSRQDTSYSRQDTSYSRQDTSYNRQDTSYNRQDSKRENKSEHKEGPINSTTFVARGEPSRRGRGARTLGGTSSSRGRGGRGTRPARGSTSAPAPSGRGGKRQDEQFKEVNREISKNGDRVSHEVDKRKSMKNERKKRRNNLPNCPPRFQNTTKRASPQDVEFVSIKPAPATLNTPAIESQGNSQDAANDEWETASDNSNTDSGKLQAKQLESKPEIKRNDAKRSFSNQRASNDRRGRAQTDKGRPDKSIVPKTKVYSLHQLNYNHPDLIEGAIREATSALEGDKSKKFVDDQKAKHKELFKMYDLNNYAGVVNVDDLPDVSLKDLNPIDPDIHDDVLKSVLDSTAPPDGHDDDDGFTPVLSKRAQKKKQEEIRKKGEEQLQVAVRKAKLDQQRLNRQKNNKGVLSTGNSGSVKHAVTKNITDTISSDIWSNSIGTWEPQMKTDSADLPADSGVESSVPSSQRSSPGTEAKLSFSHFGGTITSTSVVTTVGSRQISSAINSLQSTAEISSIVSSQAQEMTSKPTTPLPSSLSPSHGNPIGPIGNERAMKRSSSVENIATLLPNKKDSISFIADSSSDITPGAVMGGRPAAANLFPSDDLRTSSFSPFGDSLVYTEESTADVPYSNKRFNQLSSLSSQTTSSSALSGSLPSLHKLPAATGKTHEMTFSAPFGRHKPVMQPDFLDSMEISSCSSSIIMNRSKVGANPESESPEDMTLTPQHPNNNNVSHKPTPLEQTIPAPIPLPPKHILSPGPDGDGKHEQPPNSSEDLGLMSPTSPSIDFNMKMESARKAWENMPEASTASSQQQSMNQSESYTYHSSSVSGAMIEQPITSSTISNIQSVAVPIVTNSSEWKPHSDLVTQQSEQDESWKSSVAQQNPIVNPEPQENAKLQIAAAASEVPSSIHSGNYMIDTQSSIAISQPQQQQVVPSYNSNAGYMYMDPNNSPMFTPNQRIAMPGTQSAALYHQPISSTSLASNLQHMQQIYNNIPPDFNTPVYSAQTPGYGGLGQQHTAQTAYMQQNREYTPSVLLATTTVGSTAGVKPSSQNTIKSSQPQQVRSLPAAYGNNMPGMSQQTNLGNAPLAIPRPHGGAPSPAQPIYIPLMEQSRVVATQANPTLINQQMTSQRLQSTSFFNQLNQGNSGFFGQQQTSQLRQQPFQQSIPPAAVSYQQAMYSHLKPMSPTPPNQLGLEQASMGVQASPYAPIAPPSQQRGRTDDFYQSYPGYYPQKSTGSYPGSVAKVMLPPTGAGPFAVTGKPGTSTFGPVKSSQSMYGPPKSTTPVNPDAMSKFSNVTSPNSKSYMGQQPPGGDWAKAPTSNAQYKPNSVQGLLSRPFSSSNDTMYHQIATNATPSQYSHKTSDALSYQQAPRPYDQSGSWGHQKVMAQGGPGIMGAQPPISILGKAPRAPVVQGSVQRYPTMQGYQFTPQQLAVAARAQQQIGTFQMKPQPSAIRMNSPTSINQQFGTPMDYPNYSGPKQGKGGKSAVPTAVAKAPPVPTLVRGVGSNLVGKKPTFIPEDVVKSKQASERASLLQSLSAFFPDKGKNEGEEQSSSENTDWSSQVACSSPLPKRKPGMRHPGVDRRRLNAAKDDKSRSGPIGAAKIYPAKSEEIPVNENLVQTTKKLTLADTRPKKGETAQIPL